MISSCNRRTFPKFPTLNACKKISDQMWWIDLWFIVKVITKCPENQYNLVAMVTYLNENQWNVQCHRVGDRYFALTSHYSIAIYILTTRFCLVLLIVNLSQIDCLSCHMFGISMQALDFVRDGEILRPRWKFLKKSVIFFTTPPLENGLVQEVLHLGNLWRTKFLVTLDSFHGRERISVDVMIKYILCNGQTKW